MEVRLLDLAIDQRDLLPQVAEALHNSTMRHVFCRVGVDDLAAYIAGCPDSMHGDIVLRVDAHVGNFGEVTQMAEPCGDAHAAAG